MLLTLIRHGETDSNVQKRWQGQSNSSLTARGIEQARKLAARLKIKSSSHSFRFTRIVSSDLGRAVQTTELLALTSAGATEPSIRVELDAAWREINVGRWEGLTREEVTAHFSHEIEALSKGVDVRVGGGESFGDLFVRVDAAMRQLLATGSPDDHVAVVTHGAVIQAIASGAIGIRERRPRPLGPVSNTSMTTLRFEKGRPTLLRYNDATHAAPTHRWVAERLRLGEEIVRASADIAYEHVGNLGLPEPRSFGELPADTVAHFLRSPKATTVIDYNVEPADPHFANE